MENPTGIKMERYEITPNTVFLTDDNKFLINGEEVGPEDVEFDPVGHPTEPVIDGVGDEMEDTAEDVALYGKNFISTSGL